MDLVLIGIGQFVDKPICVYIACGLFDLLATDVWLPQADIGFNISGKKKNILLHHPNAFAKFLDIPLANIDTIYQNRTPLNIVEPTDQIDHSTLARARRANQGQTLPRRNAKRHIAQHPFAFVVRKPNILKRNLTLQVIGLHSAAK